MPTTTIALKRVPSQNLIGQSSLVSPLHLHVVGVAWGRCKLKEEDQVHADLCDRERYRYPVRLYFFEQPNWTDVAVPDAVEVVVPQDSPTTIFVRPLTEQTVLSVYKQAACAARAERTFCDTGKTLIASRHISQPIRLIPERSTPST